MGIPSYFSHIVRKYSKTIRKLSHKDFYCDNLYFDANSIIYDELRKVKHGDFTDEITLISKLIESVCIKIEEYILEVHPKQIVLICFDGVPPMAKLEQQRARRFKSMHQQSCVPNTEGTSHILSGISSAMITPGTEFYKSMNAFCNQYFDESKRKELSLRELIFSGSNVVGEGEHKIFEKIREDVAYHQVTNTCIYGIDSDLIMLSLNHTLSSKFHIYLYRETPHFVQSIDCSLLPDCSYLIDIPELARSIIHYMNCESKVANNDRLRDYILICFFLGNDYVSKIPSINIRTSGIDYLLNAYRKVVGTTDDTLVVNNQIQWSLLKRMFTFMRNIERNVMKQEYCHKKKLMDRYSRSGDDILAKYNAMPHQPEYSQKELKVDPFTISWDRRYYELIFGKSRDEIVPDVCINYLQSIEWCLNYYTTGECDYTWTYKYHYGPLLTDLCDHIPVGVREIVSSKNVKGVMSELGVLSYVTPSIQLQKLLPKELVLRLIERHPQWYRNDWTFEMSYCKYMWEAHVLMSSIDTTELMRIVDEYTAISSGDV